MAEGWINPVYFRNHQKPTSRTSVGAWAHLKCLAAWSATFQLRGLLSLQQAIEIRFRESGQLDDRRWIRKTSASTPLAKNYFVVKFSSWKAIFFLAMTNFCLIFLTQESQWGHFPCSHLLSSNSTTAIVNPIRFLQRWLVPKLYSAKDAWVKKDRTSEFVGAETADGRTNCYHADL